MSEPDPSSSVVHLADSVRSLGGLQSVMKHHLTQDHETGMRSHQIIFFERDDPEPGKVSALGFGWRWTISQMRRVAAQTMQPWSNRMAVYHEFWGLRFLADLDHAHRRLGYLHANPPGIERRLQAQAGLVDGVIANSQALADLTAECLPDLKAGRLGVVPLPITPPGNAFVHSPVLNRPLIIGYSGRLTKAIKRVDRLPALARHLAALGINYRLEILGGGRDQAWLQRQFAQDARTVFHGVKSGAEYWEILGGWDILVNVSDSEGLSISLLEGLSCGVIPVFPQIIGGGVAYTKNVDPSLLYRPGDMEAAARILKSLVSLPPDTWQAWRERCREAVKGHLGGAYMDAFRSFLEKIERLPRISQSQFPRRPFFLTDHVPLGLLARLAPGGLLKR